MLTPTSSRTQTNTAVIGPNFMRMFMKANLEIMYEGPTQVNVLEM